MIAVIAGHRGPKTGAIGYIDEGKETIEFRNLITKQLKKNKTEFIKDDDDANLSDVVKEINKKLKQNDICIDIHFNSVSSKEVSGTEIMVSAYADTAEKLLAQEILQCTCNILNTKNRKVKKDSNSAKGRLKILRETNCKCILVEICFASNQDDCNKYLQHKEKLAKEYANILTKYDKLLSE